MSVNEIYDNWDLDNLEITSKSVERTLEPLLEQVDILITQKGFSERRKGNSKQADTILQTLDSVIKEYLINGEKIKSEAPDRQVDFKASLDDIKSTGKELMKSAKACLEDCCNIDKRVLMMNAIKAMLSSVTRLMILADIVDVLLLLRMCRQVDNDVNMIKNSMDHQTLMENWKKFGLQMTQLLEMAGYRQNDMIDDRKRMKIAAGRGMLLQNIPLLLVTSKAYIRHPELASAKSNRDFTVKSINYAVDIIISAIKGHPSEQAMFYEKPGELAYAIDEFVNCAIMKVDQFDNSQGNKLKSRLDQIVSNCNILMASPCTREINKSGIKKYTDEAKDNLNTLLGVYKACQNQPQYANTDKLRQAQSTLLQTTDKIREFLKRSAVDHVSDNFVDISEPIKMLAEAAASGNQDNVESIVPYISETINKMQEISNLSCSVSSDQSVTQLSRMACWRLDQLTPQLITAANSLVLRPTSRLTQENWQAFRDELEKSCDLVSDSIDCMLDIWDQLVMLEAHIRDDMTRCMGMIQNGDWQQALETAKLLTNRVNRVIKSTRGEVTKFRPNTEYRLRIEEAVDQLESLMSNEFHPTIAKSIEKMRQKNGELSEQGMQELEESMQNVSDGVHDVWRAVVFGRDQSGYETDVSDKLDFGSRRGKNKRNNPGQENLEEEISPDMQPVTEEQEAMRILSGKHKEVLDREMAGFLEQRKRLMHEMTKWDETGNELVALAKKICVVLFEMTEFTRGHGNLKSTKDVIQAASNISDYGNQFNSLANEIASQCPNSVTKGDLDRYMERVTLYCHQIKITSRVKADIQNIGGEIVVSGLDSVTSLIEAGKNLMASVVETVKSCYIASTKYPGRQKIDDYYSKGGSSGYTGANETQTKGKSIQWRMKAPRKKPLVTPSGQYDEDEMNMGSDEADDEYEGKSHSSSNYKRRSNYNRNDDPRRRLDDFDQS